jgi:hypothetical protein
VQIASNEPESEELHDARALARAVLLGALSDLEEAIDREWGVRTGQTLPFTDRSEVENWIFSDTHTEDVIIDGQPALSETQAFESPLMPQRLTLEIDSDGTFSFRGVCQLLSMDHAAIRRKVRSWINARDSGQYIPLTALPVVAANRAKAMMRVHQAETWRRNGYPQPVVKLTFGPRLAGPAPKRKPLPPDVRERQERAVRSLDTQGVDRSAIALTTGLSRDRVRSILRRASRAKAVNKALEAAV